MKGSDRGSDRVGGGSAGVPDCSPWPAAAADSRRRLGAAADRISICESLPTAAIFFFWGRGAHRKSLRPGSRGGATAAPGGGKGNCSGSEARVEEVDRKTCSEMMFVEKTGRPLAKNKTWNERRHNQQQIRQIISVNSGKVSSK